MRTKIFALLPLAAAVAGFTLPAGASLKKSAPHAPWMQRVDSILGSKGEVYSEDVLRYSLSRSDLKVAIGGRGIKPSLALDGYVAFKNEGSSALAIGEMVLTGSQVDTASQSLSASGLKVDAIHNHLIGETPDVYFLHFEGQGDAAKLASSVRAAIKATGIPAPDNSSGSQETAGLNKTAITSIMKETPRVMDGVLEYTAERKERVTENGAQMPADMGPESEIHFQPIGTGDAVMVAELAVSGSEAPGIVRYLRSSGVQVTALHNHFLTASPQIFFIHAWGQGNAVRLARTAHTALSKTNSK